MKNKIKKHYRRYSDFYDFVIGITLIIVSLHIAGL